jgi:hypothetical protein
MKGKLVSTKSVLRGIHCKIHRYVAALTFVSVVGLYLLIIILWSDPCSGERGILLSQFIYNHQTPLCLNQIPHFPCI